MRAVLVLLAAALVAAGCGGGNGDGDGSGGTFSRDASASCLRDAGAEVSTATANLDYVAETARGGGINAEVDGTSVTVAFSHTDSDAERLEAAYRIFAEGFGVPVDDVLKREGNAVIMWDATPTNAKASTVEDCLRS